MSDNGTFQLSSKSAHLFDGEAGHEVDHVRVLTDVVGPHPATDLCPLFVSQSKRPPGVLKLLGQWRDPTQLHQVSIAPRQVHHTIDTGGGPGGSIGMEVNRHTLPNTTPRCGYFSTRNSSMEGATKLKFVSFCAP